VGFLDKKVPETKENKEKKTDEDVAHISPIHPGDTRGRGRRHLLDTCE